MPHPSRPRCPSEQWQQLVEAQAVSGQSQAAFCAEHGLSKSSFQLWKRRLRAAYLSSPNAALFTPLMGTAEPSRTTTAWNIELDRGDGVCLRLRRSGTLWLCTEPTGMRRSYDGLAAMVRRQLGENPLSGHGFVFINRRRAQLKCLYFDAGGCSIWSKRLEQGRFGVRRPASSPTVSLSRTEFEALIEGLW